MNFDNVHNAEYTYTVSYSHTQLATCYINLPEQCHIGCI